MFRKRKRPEPFAWVSASIFLMLLALAPLVGARIISETFGGRGMSFEVNAGSIATTRDAIDSRFRALVSNVSDKRKAWSDIVNEQLDRGRLKTSRGFLLAAPQMLDSRDSAALLAAAKAQSVAGEDAIVAAALSFLNEDVRVKYEQATSPVAALWRAAIDAPEGDATAENETADTVLEKLEDGAPSLRELNTLGDERDLALQASQWVRGGEINTFAFSLSAVGLTSLDPGARAGASVLRSADRANRLNENLKQHFQNRLFMAAPPERLKRDLTVRFSSSLSVAGQTDAMMRIIRADLDPKHIAPLEDDLLLVRDISANTSALSAIIFLELAHNSIDLRRAKLLTEAGGDKALALAVLDSSALSAAKTPIHWTNRLRLMIAIMAGMGVVALWLAFETLVRSIQRARPVKRSAVYRLEEPEWEVDSSP